MNTTVGLRAAQGRLVAEPVQIDVAAARVHIAATIVACLQPFEPKDAVHDGGIGPALPGEADGLALFSARPCQARPTARRSSKTVPIGCPAPIFSAMR